MAIPAAALVHPTFSVPLAKLRFVYPDDDPRANLLTQAAQILLQEALEFLSGTGRIIPVSITGTNALLLTIPASGPRIIIGRATGANGYHDYDVFSGVAAATSTGAVTAAVATADRPAGATITLPTLKVYTTNGGAQAGAGDLTIGRHYSFTYVDSLDSAAGGLVLR